MKVMTIRILLALSLIATVSVAADEIGSVIAIQGKATATGKDGKQRALGLNSPIFLMDKVVSEEKAKIQIQFDDDSIISQGEKSEMTIDEYVYSPSKKGDNSCSVKMMKGAFRVLTGKITKLNPARFKARTKMATIGIRGCDLGFTVSEAGDNIYIIQLHGQETITVETKAEARGLWSGLIGVKWEGEKTEKKLLNVLKSGMIISIAQGGVTQRDMTPADVANLITSVTPQTTSGAGTGETETGGTGTGTESGETDTGESTSTGEATGTETTGDTVSGETGGTGDGTAAEGTGDAAGTGVAGETGTGTTGDDTTAGTTDGTTASDTEVATGETAPAGTVAGEPVAGTETPAPDAGTVTTGTEIPVADAGTMVVGTEPPASDAGLPIYDLTASSLAPIYQPPVVPPPPPPLDAATVLGTAMPTTPTAMPTTPTATPTTPTVPNPVTTFTAMGSGTDWSWGVWDTDGVYNKVEFSSSKILTSAQVQAAIASGANPYTLTCSGAAAAIITHAAQNALVSGPCGLAIEVGYSTTPTWDGSFDMINSGGDALNFTAQGNIHSDGSLSGGQTSYSMKVHGTTFDRATISSHSIQGNVFGPSAGGKPIGGAVGSFNFQHGGSATVNGGFGVNAN